MVYKSFFYYFIKKVDCNIIYGHIQLNNINKMDELIRRYNKCIYDELNKYINSGKELEEHMMTINDSGIDACKIIIFSFQNTFSKLI